MPDKCRQSTETSATNQLLQQLLDFDHSYVLVFCRMLAGNFYWFRDLGGSWSLSINFPIKCGHWGRNSRTELHLPKLVQPGPGPGPGAGSGCDADAGVSESKTLLLLYQRTLNQNSITPCPHTTSL